MIHNSKSIFIDTKQFLYPIMLLKLHKLIHEEIIILKHFLTQQVNQLI